MQPSLYTTRPLQSKDLPFAAALDRKWFGKHGISESELAKFVTTIPDSSLALLTDDQSMGFATFEIIENTNPKEQKGFFPEHGKILFIQQFTTTSNYKIGDQSVDEALLAAVETKAKELECVAVWESLAVDHPYSKNQNPEFDAFGFYHAHGYTYDRTKTLTWLPDSKTSVHCYLFRKELMLV